MSQTSPPGPRVNIQILLSGFLMGGADIIPGVAGGTVALILGIYTRLVTAISRIDSTFISCLLQRKFRKAIQHADLQFLFTLGAGIAAGVISLAGLMHFLLLNYHTLTLAVFFGLIVASSWLVAKIVQRWNAAEYAGVLLGGLFAFWLVGLPLFQQPPNSFAYLFFCGTVAICAMILPGISGAFILLLLGKYAEITGMIKGLVHGEISGEIVLSIITFAAGCLFGLLGFSKLLKLLLSKYESIMMAILCGFMIGSLRKLWPFQKDMTPDITELKHKIYQNLPMNDALNSTELLPAICLIVLAAICVLALEKWASGVQKAKSLSENIE